MKQKGMLSTFAAVVVAIGILLNISVVQAGEVAFDPDDPNKATDITNLDIGGTNYNVNFVSQTTALAVYGEVPGDYDFETNSTAAAAVDAVNAALNAKLNLQLLRKRN